MNQGALVDKLVLEYLEKRGLGQTARQLKAESQALSQLQMTLAPSRGVTGIVSDLLHHMTSDGKPAHYSKSFDALAEWVDSSLDMYRYELSQVLYPVFLHCCLKLVANEAGSEATQLIGRYSQRFTTIGGQPSKVRMQELNELQAVSIPEHLTTNRIAQAVQRTRFPVRLCTYSHELLMHFLQGQRLFLVLGIINDHIKFEVTESQPSSLPLDAEKEISLLSGQMEAGMAGASLTDVNLNLLQGMAEDKVAAARAAADAEDIPDVDEGGRPLTKKERTARHRAATKEREAVADAHASRMVPEIPLPSLSEDILAGQVADIEARASLSSEALPSAVFFTFVNTHQTLNCVTFTHNCSHVAGGFADSSVRVYDIGRAAAAREAAADDEPGSEVAFLHGHSGAVFGVDFSHDRQLLFSASADGTVRLWHMELEACLNSYRGHNYPVWDVAAGPLGHYFASAGADRTARVWSVERTQALRILAGHYTDVDVVQWHPNAHYLATGSSDHTLRLWDIRDGQAQRTLIGHRAAITAMAFHPDGTTLASADEDGVVITWDLAQAKQLRNGEKHKAAVWSLSFSNGGGSLLASGGADNSLRLWNTSGAVGGESSELQLLKSFHTKATPVFCTQFTPRNLLLGSGALTLNRKQK